MQTRTRTAVVFASGALFAWAFLAHCSVGTPANAGQPDAGGALGGTVLPDGGVLVAAAGNGGVSGSRLRVYRQTSVDGLSVPVVGRYFDSQLGVDCVPLPYEDGVTRCLPGAPPAKTTYDVSFLDQNCSDAIVYGMSEPAAIGDYEAIARGPASLYTDWKITSEPVTDIPADAGYYAIGLDGGCFAQTRFNINSAVYRAMATGAGTFAPVAIGHD